MDNENNKTSEAEVKNCCMVNGKCCRTGKWKGGGGCGTGGGAYGLAFIGAAVYYVQMAETFGQGAIGILKAMVWPGILVYKLLEYLSI